MYHTLYILRSYLGLSQTKLAKEIGITQPDLSEMETLPPYGYISKYQRASEYLGVPLEALVKDRPSLVPESFFEKHPAPEYTPIPVEADKRLGRMGEEFIFRREQARLKQRDPVLARLVLPFFKMRNTSSPGFDILSFDEKGNPISLEVKTTLAAAKSFRLTNNEMVRAQKLTEEGGRYIVCCLTGWGGKSFKVYDIPFETLVETHQIVPMHYRCSPKTEEKLESISGLAHFRRMRGLRQEELADALDIPPCELSMYETGARQPAVSFYVRVSELLGVTLDDLLARYEGVQSRTGRWGQ